MNKTIPASVIILLVVLFPFRLSFMSPDVTCVASIFNFILVILGILVFLFLKIGKDKEHSSYASISNFS